MNIVLREYESKDLSSVASIWNQVIRDEEGFLWYEEFPEGKVEYVLGNQDVIICAVNNNTDEIAGFYILHSNSSGAGGHVANAMYAVRKDCRGNGIGKLMGSHSIISAKEIGYEGLQFNSVIATNKASIRLWERLGFIRVGEVPKGYKSKSNQYSDLYIYYMRFPN